MDIEAKFCLQWAGLLQHETGDTAEHQAFRVGVTWLAIVPVTLWPYGLYPAPGAGAQHRSSSLADSAKHDHAARHLAVSVMDRCLGLGDGEFAAVAADQGAVGGFVGEVEHPFQRLG